MAEKADFWQKTGIRDWFLAAGKNEIKHQATGLTPDEVYKYILERFKAAVKQLSFANRVVFYHEYIICFNEEDYREFLSQKQGLFGIIIHECVGQFYQILEGYRKAGKTVAPAASKWVFRLVSHPDYERGDMGFIGKLMPGTAKKEENLRVTFIPRQTGIAETMDVSQDILNGFTYYSEGYYELPYTAAETAAAAAPAMPAPAAAGQTIARLETILPDAGYRGKKLEFLMKETEIIVSGQDESRKAPGVFVVPSDWVSTPHLKIRYDRKAEKLYLAAFGEKTMLNEKELTRSEPSAPVWNLLPFNSKILLNGIIGINIFKP